MKVILWLISAIFFVLAMIFSFQNTSIIVPTYFFLTTMNSTLFFPFVLLFLCGFGTGLFLGISFKTETEDEEEY